MKKIMDRTLDRKENYVRYGYHKLSYDIDAALVYLLDKIAQIDGGTDTKTFLKENDYVLGSKH